MSNPVVLRARLDIARVSLAAASEKRDKIERRAASLSERLGRVSASLASAAERVGRAPAKAGAPEAKEAEPSAPEPVAS